MQLRNGRLLLVCPCLRAQSDTAGEFYAAFSCDIICKFPFKHTGKVLAERLCDGECLSGKLQLWVGVSFVWGGGAEEGGRWWGVLLAMHFGLEAAKIETV